MKAWKLAELSYAELEERRKAIENDPKNRNPPGSFWIFTAKARVKLEILAWAVTYKLMAKKKIDTEGL